VAEIVGEVEEYEEDEENEEDVGLRVIGGGRGRRVGIIDVERIVAGRLRRGVQRRGKKAKAGWGGARGGG